MSAFHSEEFMLRKAVSKILTLVIWLTRLKDDIIRIGELIIQQTHVRKSPVEHLQRKTAMVTKTVGTSSKLSAIFVLCLPLTPYNVDLSRDMGSLAWPWGTIRPIQCLIFKIQHYFGGRGLSFSFTG